MPRLVAGLLLLLLPVLTANAADDLLLYAPFDGSLAAVLAQGQAASPGELGSFVPGLRGQALVLRSDCSFPAAGNFRPTAGTVAFWVRPHWPGTDPTSHHLFCLYGDRTLPHAWAVNRWNVVCAGGRCTFSLYTREEGVTHHLSASVAEWQPETWHHVAFTWENLNSGKADAALRLYLDGNLAASLTGKQIDVGPSNEVFAVGRDQDASPDYGDADCDDLFVYGRPLTETEIAAGVAAARETPYEVAGLAAPSTASRPAGWQAPRRFRCLVTLPANAAERSDLYLQAPLNANADLAALGVSGTLDETSVAVYEAGKGEVLPCRLEEGLLQWQAPGVTAAGAARRFGVYFDTQHYVVQAPLLAQRAAPDGKGNAVPLALPDYATATFGKGWDFDDGTFSGIDQWGNKPEYIQNRKVENGVLSMDVTQDPWFIWGDMWGQVRAQKPYAIDVDKYSLLEMKVRQSVASADWEIFGRPGTSERLFTHKFTVTGTGWQRVRVNLATEARWRGVLTALRVDPTQGTTAHVEIDWVRLLAVAPVSPGPVEALGEGATPAAHLALGLAKHNVTAGATQPLIVTVTDAAGRPLAGQPVRVAVSTGSGGELTGVDGQRSLALSPQERRGLTDAAGQLRVNYRASRKALKAADTLTATAEFTAVKTEATAVDTVPGSPHHYRVSPTKVVALKLADLPLKVTAQLVDEFDNAVAGQRTLQWATDPEAKLLEATPKLQPSGLATARWQGDEGKRWVYTVRVTDAQGLTGASAAICLLPSKPRQDPIVLGPNGYFRRGANGPAWLPLGGFYANWVGLPEGGEEGRKLVSFVDATEPEMDHWLSFLHDQGVTGMRFMLRAHTKQGMEPMDVIGRVNMPLFAKVLRYLDLARKYDIRFMLTIHEDYTKPAYYNRQALETFCLPRYSGEDLDKLPPYQRRFVRDRKLIDDLPLKYTDPDVMACQDQYTRELLGLLKDNPQLFSWEFENEMVDCPQSWANHMAEVIRAADPVTPICASHGGGGLHTADPLWWTKRTKIDFYTYHLYPGQGTTPAGFDFGAAADVLSCYGRMAGVCMFGETSGDEFSRYPTDRDADRRYIMRDLIWFPLMNGNPGCFFWNARGFEVEQFRLANRILSGLDLRTWQRAKPDVGLLVEHPWENDKYYRSPEGQADYRMLGRYDQHYLSAGVDYDFTMTPGAYAHQADLKTFAPVDGTSRLRPAAGWQVRANARQDLAQGVAYVRNFAGVHEWSIPRAYAQLRDRKAAPLKLRLNLPAAQLQVVATDLDTGQERRLTIGGQGEVDLGVSEHDWAVVWKAE